MERTLIIKNSEVHIWLLSLKDNINNLKDLNSFLSEDEIERAGKFHFEKDRNNYIIARGTLRKILSLYLKIEADKIEFSYNSYGMPYLNNKHNSSLKFNLSHSGNFAIYTFTYNKNIGIDIEYISESLSCEEIADRFFSPEEVAMLKSVPEDKKKRAFFNCWTRKEACIKAVGKGLSMPLSDFTVSLIPGEPPGLIYVKDKPEAPSQWTLKELEINSDYVASVAVKGEGLEFIKFLF